MSPRAKARLAGVFEALEGFPAAFGQVYVFGSLVVAGNAPATAHNLLTHAALVRLGFAIPLLAVGFHIVWALLFYQLFKPVNRTINLLATLIILVGCAIQAAAAVFYLTPLLILQGGPSLSAFSSAQQQDLALWSVDVSHLAFNVYLIFFGFWCLLTGYLIVQSTFLPRILGVLLALDGLGWMMYLWPPLATSIYPVIRSDLRHAGRVWNADGAPIPLFRPPRSAPRPAWPLNFNHGSEIWRLRPARLAYGPGEDQGSDREI